MVRKMVSLFCLLLIAILALSASNGARAQTPAATQAAAAGAIKLTEWDYYTAGDAATVWGNLLTQCGADNNITLERQSIPRNELISKVLLAAQQQQLPDVLMIDNPDLQEVASTGALAQLTDYGVDLKGLYPNLIDAGSLNGKVYGIAPGINGMAIFYNVDMLNKANLKPPTTWAEVKDVAAKLTGNGVYGIAFSAVATEEGSWQFEPWFWGAGGDLKKLDSPEGVKALQFWVDLLNSGSASKSVVTWAQGDANDQFVAGKAAMQQNGVWNLGALDKAGIKYGGCPIPKPDGGAAPGPMGGEGLTIPLSNNQSTMH